MGVRAFTTTTSVSSDHLALALAPALTPEGPVADPSFFHGFATEPQVLARGLLSLADITATRYFKYTPTTQRDPVLTAHGDRLRAEVFSACNSVYARFDLLASGMDGGDVARGTTNVDLGMATRRALAAIGRNELLHLEVGRRGLVMATPGVFATERPVEMPGRWIPALGNVAELHRALSPAFSVGRAAARALLASIPAATGAAATGWLTPAASGIRVAPRRTAGAVHVHGLHRLSALKRLIPHVNGLTVYASAGDEPGATAFEVELPHARMLLGLTTEAWRGFSGEGSLLGALADPVVAEVAALVSALLSFEPVIDVERLRRAAGLTTREVESGIAVLAASGRVGWDLEAGAHFHRELPDEPERVTRDNPRVAAARRLVAAGLVDRASAAGEWLVHAGSATEPVSYTVREADGSLSCTCTWQLTGRGDRGPCKHALAVQILTKETR
ncbi:SWIM zinc finger domain-containing protein [Agromyces endophyticus]|uniref:SWIM zinc finger family protein n=1 Tax=Agromyces sp. H17E-10 TaxID=2932244 RepID=UPI001FD13024|nr:SWIM zinc finger family protein [Agromyces sp. H17E-10]UOQ89361.1 SWIM zinc finger domain-containing protein [Agromyces sp. H17E-10]